MFPRRRRPALLSWLFAAVLAVALALPAVRWEPLHVDEVVTLDVAPRSFASIVDRVFVERGGGPVHFFVEHVALRVDAGVAGLRVPSLAFFVLALPAAGLLAGELAGSRIGLLAAPALAVSPLAVGLATFGRMYSLLLAGVLWATWAAVRLGGRGGLLAWAAGGALLGLLVYVHPLAPLYGGLGLATALLVGVRSRAAVPRAAAAPVAFVVVGLPYYLHALALNRERYEVESGAGRIETTHGRGVITEIAHALTPGGTVGAYGFSLLAVVGLAWLLLRRRRAGLALGLSVAAPIAFFDLVPVEGTRFFPRYVLPVLPPFLVLVLAGGLALVLLRRRLVAAGPVLAAAALFAAAVPEDARRLASLHRLGLPKAVEAVRERLDDGILFASTGRTTYARSPRLLSTYVALEEPRIERMPERSCTEVARFVRGGREARIGLWLFRGREARIVRAEAELTRVRGVVWRRLSDELLLVRTAGRQPPARLVELGAAIRLAWVLPEYGDGAALRLVAAGRRALAAADSGRPCSEVDVPPLVLEPRP